MVMLGPGDLRVKQTESLLSQSVRYIEVMEEESCNYSVARNMLWWERQGDIMGALGFGSPWGSRTSCEGGDTLVFGCD